MNGWGGFRRSRLGEPEQVPGVGSEADSGSDRSAGRDTANTIAGNHGACRRAFLRMRTRICQTESRRGGVAFTLIEVVFTMAMAGMLFLVLYEGLASGFSIIKLARENTRASQILVEKMETVRLYTWDQINSNGFMLTNFVVAYYPMAGVNGGTMYTGVVTVSDSGLATSYAGDLKKVTVQLNWLTGSMPRTRTTSTYVSRYGLQNYINY